MIIYEQVFTYSIGVLEYMSREENIVNKDM